MLVKWYTEYNPWYIVTCAWFLILYTLCLILGTIYLRYYTVSNTCKMVNCGAWYTVPWHQDLVTRYLLDITLYPTLAAWYVVVLGTLLSTVSTAWAAGWSLRSVYLKLALWYTVTC